MISCEYCAVLLNQNDKEEHLQLDCQRAIVSCPFADLGCGHSQVERQHLLKHQEKGVIIHVELLRKTLTSIIKEYSQHSSINNVVETESIQTKDSSSFGNQLQTESAWSNVLFNYENMCKALYKKNLELEHEKQELLNEVKILQKKIVSLEEKMSNGIYYWRVQNFTSLENEASIKGFKPKPLMSPGFYTGPHGYRAILRITLESKGNGNYNVSLFMHLMQGDHDDFLLWPMSGKIKLSILDRQDSERSRRHIFETMNSNPQSSAFQRPTEECNPTGFGYKEFTNSDFLHNTMHQYLKNDTLIIKAEVVPTILP